MSIRTKVLAVAAGTMVAAGLLAASPASADGLIPTTTTVVVDKASLQAGKGGTAAVTLTATVRSPDGNPAPFGTVELYLQREDKVLVSLSGFVELKGAKEVKDGKPVFYPYSTASLTTDLKPGKYDVVVTYNPPSKQSGIAASQSEPTSFEVTELPADPPAEDPPAEDPPADDPTADDPTDAPTDGPTDGPTTGPVVDPDRSVPGVPGFTG